METADLVLWIEQVAGTLIMLIMVSAALRAWVSREFPKALASFTTGAYGMLLAFGTLNDLGRTAYNSLHRQFGAAGTASPPKTPPAHRTGDALSSGTLLTALLILLGAAVAGGAAAAAVYTLKRQRERTAHKAELKRRWDLAQADHDLVLDQWTSYITDPLAHLDRPTLGETTVPQTVAFLHALDAAADARAGSDPEAYRTAVSALKTAFQTADAHATRVGLSHLATAERTRVRRARALLVTAMDDRAGHPLAQAALARSQELLAGVLPLPRETQRALDTAFQLSLNPRPTQPPGADSPDVVHQPATPS